MTRKDKIQHLLISYLLKHGSIELKLPDGIDLEIGITQEDKYGSLIKEKDYCWVVTKRCGKLVEIDSYNLGLNFLDEGGIILIDEDEVEDTININVV
jgi:hypothetical protein